MLQGTFREWANNDAPGIFSATDDRGVTTTVQLAEYQPGQIIYEVFRGYHTDGFLRTVECHFNHINMIVDDNMLTWETVGEVTDG